MNEKNIYRKDMRKMTKVELALELEYVYQLLDIRFLQLLPSRQTKTQRTRFLHELYNFIKDFNKRYS